MNTGTLLQKLIELERAIGVETESNIRYRVLEAEECLLSLQRQSLDYLRTGGDRFTMLRQFASPTGDDIS